MAENTKNKIAKEGDEAPKKPFPIGYADEAQLNAWKEKHKRKSIYEIISEDEEGVEHATYVKSPTLDLLQLLATKAKQNAELTGLKLVLEGVRVGGSDELMEDEMHKLSVMTAVGKMFKRKENKVKKR